jgi:hypothetical protein
MLLEKYREFIREAFINPIRSVLIVDDDYPTFDEILGIQIAANENATSPPLRRDKDWYRAPGNIRKVIDRFRSSAQPLLVDIHDGTNVDIGREPKAATHLHQSDLLVLDYQLDKDRKGDGTRAIDIARALASNTHFNMVLVHTGEKLERVFREMLLGLMTPLQGLMTADAFEEAQFAVAEFEEDHEGIGERISAAISTEHYLHFRKFGGVLPLRVTDNAPSGAAFEEAVKLLGVDSNVALKLMLWAMKKRELSLERVMNNTGAHELSWSEDNPRWLRTDSLFMAFTNKGHSDDLLDELLSTLAAWQPRPSRLFLAMLRAQLEEYGVVAETKALGSNHVLAHWYLRLLESDGAERDYLIAESVGRHSEQLLDYILPKVAGFATRLVEAEGGDPKQLCKTYFDVDLSKPKVEVRSQLEHNAFVCSKKVEGYHLNTGHILEFESEFWVCLSPACDLVPGRKTPKRFGNIGETLPFMAVKLQEMDQEKLPKRVQSNRFIFLEFNGVVRVFCISDPSSEGASPLSFTLYADREGVFEKGEHTLKILRIVSDGEAGLRSESCPAKVVSQLRYEYALNLTQKLGSATGRVGLDFVGK